MATNVPQRYELVSPDQLLPHPHNPRRGRVKEIAASIETNGFYGTVIVQESTGFILAGNHRWQAAVTAGITEIPVVYVDVDDATATRIVLADNRTSDLGSYDTDELMELISTLDGDIAGTGYDASAVERLIEQTSGGVEAPDQSGLLADSYGVAVTDLTEQGQLELLDRLTREGFTCRALLG